MPTTTFTNLPAAKRSRVTAALLTEFSAHSLADAQVARIVKTAGIARGAFYKYFADLTDAYQFLFHTALADIHAGFGPVNAGQFQAQRYYDPVAAFVEHVTNSQQYYQLIQRHYAENESLVPPLPVSVDLSAVDWAAMTLSHAAIKEVMQQPTAQAVILQRLQQALNLLASQEE